MDRAESTLIDWIANEREPLIASAQRITRRRDLAEDATQEALVQAWRKRQSLFAAREPRAVLRWLTKLHAGMARRGEARHCGERDLERLAGVLAPESNVDREGAERAWLEIARLPVPLREALELRFRQGLTFAEIAEHCGIAEGTAHERVERGIEQLRKRMPRETPRPSRSAWCLLPWRWFGSGTRISLCVRVATLGFGSSLVLIGSRSPADVAARSVAAEIPPSITTPEIAEVEFDLDAFRQRVDLDSYLDAGGSLPPRSLLAEDETQYAGIRGRAFDARGRVLDDARIEIRRRIKGVDLEIVVGRTSTEFDGTFALDGIPLEGALKLVVLRRTLVALECKLALNPDAANDLGTLITDAVIEDRRGEFTLELLLRDASGRPLIDAPTTLSHRLDAFAGAPTFEQEDSGRTDSDGRIRLTGSWIGGKRLQVGSPNHSTSPPARSIEFSIERGGIQSLELTLR